MKVTVLLALLFGGLFSLKAQQIKGSVVSDANHYLANVSIYVDGTKLGTSTAEDGTFVIDLPKDLSGTLVFQKDDYESYSVKTASIVGKNVKVVLNKVNEIEEVVIIPFTDEAYNNYIRYFLNQFIGRYQDEVKIKNQKSLKFSFDKKLKVLRVKAPQILIIENKRLGYTLEYNLINFVSDFKTNIISFYGTSYFKENKVSDRQKLNRINAYDGSLMHFLRSVYTNQVTENGFNVNEIKIIPNPKYPTEEELGRASEFSKEFRENQLSVIPEDIKDILARKNNQPATSYLVTKANIQTGDYFKQMGDFGSLDFANVLQVQYQKYFYELKKGKPYKGSGFVKHSSYLHSSENPFTVTADGNVDNPEEFLTQGDFTFNKISDLLPLDYQLGE